MIGGENDVVKRLDPIFAALAPGNGRHSAHRGPGKDRRHRRAGLSALRPERRRPFRQNGPQRNRVRNHGGVRRRVWAFCAPRTSASRLALTVDAETTPLRDPEHYQYDLNLRDIAEVWRRGSVIASWLLDLTASCPDAGSESLEVCRPGLRLRRRALDHQSGDRRSGSGAGSDQRALRAVQLARRGRLRQQAAVRDALSNSADIWKSPATNRRWLEESTVTNSHSDALVFFGATGRPGIQEDLSRVAGDAEARPPQCAGHRRGQSRLDSRSAQGARTR